MKQAKDVHKDAIIIDCTCPLAVLDDYHDNYMRGGVTVIAATVGYGMADIGNLDFTMKTIGKWFAKFREEGRDLLHVNRVDDIFKAKEEGKLGVIFHFQGTTPFEDDINTVELYHRLGVRMCQLCYNDKDLVGCGSAVEDDLIKAIAQNGGVIGFNGFPGFVADKPRPTLDDLLDHVDHMAGIAGPENICVGIDYFEYQAGVADDDTATQIYNFLLDSGSWNREEYPSPPWHWPEGIEMPEKLENLTIELYERGYSEDEIKGILGLNVIRVFKEVW